MYMRACEDPRKTCTGGGKEVGKRGERGVGGIIKKYIYLVAIGSQLGGCFLHNLKPNYSTCNNSKPPTIYVNWGWKPIAWTTLYHPHSIVEHKDHIIMWYFVIRQCDKCLWHHSTIILDVNGFFKGYIRGHTFCSYIYSSYGVTIQTHHSLQRRMGETIITCKWWTFHNMTTTFGIGHMSPYHRIY